MNDDTNDRNVTNSRTTVRHNLNTHMDNLSSDMQRGNLTISQFMSRKNIQGGVSLDYEDDRSASALLASDKPHQYMVGRLIARGGMGLILNAKDLNCRRDVAMKIMGQSNVASKEQILRFIIEAQITAQLEHPSIVPVYELSVDANDDVYYTMKLVNGLTLVDILEDIKVDKTEALERYPLMRLLTIFIKICEAMAYAHSKGVLHRDLKPENIMIGDYGEVLLMDWGLAKILEPGDSDPAQFDGERGSTDGGGLSMDDIDSILSDHDIEGTFRTIDGQIMGTPGFMPPEQALGKVKDVNIRSDVYALGGILYNILTLQPSVTARNLASIVDKIVTGDIRPPVAFNDEKTFPHCPNNKIPENLSAIAMKAMQPNPEDRYETVNALQSDIEKYIGGFATSVEDQGLFKLLMLMIKRHKREVAWAASVVTLVTVLASGFMIQIVKAKNLAEENLNKFLQEQTARQDLTRKLLSSALHTITVRNPKVADLNYEFTLREHDFSLILKDNPALTDISALKVLPLRKLDLSNTKTDSIKALRGMPLTWLNLANTDVSDLSPLEESELTFIDISNTNVSDLEPLAGLPISRLNIAHAPVATLRAIESMPITSLNIDNDQMQFVYSLIDMSVTHLGIADADNAAIRPLSRVKLDSLELHGRRLNNIDSLENMDLADLALVSTKLRDLDVLATMPLKKLRIYNGSVNDLSPLADMSLEELRLEKCYFVRDLQPISECRTLRALLIPPHVTDIEFLRDHPALEIIADNVEDFERGQPKDEFWNRFDSEKQSEKGEP